MRILGLSEGDHDVHYVILNDGLPELHIEMERHTRVKEDSGDVVDFFLKNYSGPKRFDKIVYVESKDKLPNRYPESWAKLQAENAECIGHHTSHAANAYYSSGFDNALVVTMDGGGHEEGRGVTFTVWSGEGNRITPLKKVSKKSRVFDTGSLYGKVTSRVLGWKPGPPFGNRCGTTMAMAAFGVDRFLSSLDDLDKLKSLVQTEQDRFDVAASIQSELESKVKSLMEPHLDGVKNLCLGGGVSMNSVMTGKMLDWWPDLKIYVCPVPYDGGTAWGAAQYHWHHVLGNPPLGVYSSPYQGYNYSRGDIVEAIQGLNVTKGDDSSVISLLQDGKIISVYGGRSESGRRALGNRSILADPRDPTMKEKINEKVKHRMWFRPFAPSVRRDRVWEWFGRDIDSPYMSFAIKVKPEKRDIVPAIVHVDGTSRLQTVTTDDNLWYFDFLMRWEEATGVPIILNTSFNDREPIVETPEDAVNCFLGTDIDYLYFYEHGLLVRK